MAIRDRFDGMRSGRGGGLRWGNILNIIVRFVQIIMACVVIGYYASDLNAARKVHKYSDSKWVCLCFAILISKLKEPGLCRRHRFHVSHNSARPDNNRLFRSLQSCRLHVRMGVDLVHLVGSSNRTLWQHVLWREPRDGSWC